MSKCICANMDKEEYIVMGDLPGASCIDRPECQTVEYFLANEWSGDKIMFAFKDMNPGDYCTFKDETLYDNVIDKFEERSVLGKVPEYKYIVNHSKNEYFSKENIPVGDDGTLYDPITLLLSTSSDNSVIGFSPNAEEKENIGNWINGSISATNNLSKISGYSLIVPNFRNEKNAPFGPFKGLNIVVTGGISGFDRMDVKNFISSHGGNPQDSVTKATDLLVVGTKPGKTKLDKASKYGIKTIDEKEFFEMAASEEV